MKRFVVVLSTWAMGVAMLGVMSPMSASAQVPAVTPPVPVSIPGGFTPLSPSRLLDTRDGTGAPKVAVAAKGTVHLLVADKGGVPASGVSAVVLNVTVTAPTTFGFVTVYADGAGQPTASNLNFVKGQTVPNLVIAPVGANGKVDLYNGSTGTIQLLADVSGYSLAGDPTAAGAFASLAPFRLLDTREGTGAPKAAVTPGGTVSLQVAGTDGIPASGVSAVILNVTVTSPTSFGFVTASASGIARPTASNLNFIKAQTVPNLVIAPVGADGKVDLYNGSTGTTQLIADVSGYYLAGAPAVDGAFGALAPFRLLDTRDGTGAPQIALGPQESVNLQVTGRGAVPASGVSAVVLNVTVTSPTSFGFVTASADGMNRPTASNLNFVKSQTVPNLVIAPVGANGQVELFNGSTGTIQLIADVSGWFMGSPMIPGSISGTVTDAGGTHHGLAGVNVQIESVAGDMYGSVITGADGTYLAEGLTAATDYQVCFIDSSEPPVPTGGSSDATGYVWQCWKNQPVTMSGTYTPVTVKDGVTTAGIDAALAAGGALSGTVTEAGGTGHGLGNVSVEVFSPSTNVFWSATTAADGSYTVIGLPAGTDFQACFSDAGASGGSAANGYVNQCYDGQPTPATATPVAVAVGATKTGINAALVANP